MLNCNQEDVLKYLGLEHNSYITGSAGSGKTYVINQWAANTEKNIALTATTGIAALNLGGETIHRFLGIGISTRPFEIQKIANIWSKIKKSTTPWDKARCKVMKALEVIVIDEVSMLRRDQFELIDATLSHIKENSLPFGGVQIVLCGDFLQLPPVITEQDLYNYSDLKQPYCFQSDMWKHGEFKSFNLTKNYRQCDGNFLEALEQIRIGIISPEIDDMLASRVNVKLNTDLQPIKLFSHKIKAEMENLENLNKLPDAKIYSEAILTGKEYDKDLLLKDCPAEKNLSFCKGAQIMMITNDIGGNWVNGTMGIVEETNPVIIRLSNGKKVEINRFTWERTVYRSNGNEITPTVVATLSQYPFKLAWSTTLHKIQGLTLDYAEMDLSSCFVPGQCYVGLSRVKTLEGLKLTGWNKKSVKADPAVLKFYNL